MFLSPLFIWGLLGILLIGAEMFAPGFVIFFFGAGAVLTGILSALIPGLESSWGLQALIWLGSSILSLSFLRKRFAHIFRGTILNNTEIPPEIGGSAVVVERITPDEPGRIKFQGTTWKAISYTEIIEPGEPVDILDKENLTYIVAKSILNLDL
jgi:inner membrane protein